jgi:putative MATE family efflux protein
MRNSDFSVGSVPRLIMRLSGPMMIAQLVNVCYSIVDRIYLGHLPGAGDAALAGVGLTFPLITLISSFAVLAGEGGAPLASIARGAEDIKTTGRVIGNSFFLQICFGVLLTIVGLIAKAPFLWTFGATENTFPHADAYITTYLMGSVFVMISLGMNPFLNTQGLARAAMTSVAIGALANIILDPIFIYALDMGTRGAALATIISQGFSAAWTIKYLTGRRCLVPLTLANIKPEKAVIVKIISLGISNFTMKVTESAVQIVCNWQLKLYGGHYIDVYMATMTIINSIRQVAMMVFSGLSQGTQPVIGFNYGARQYSRVRHAIRFFTIACAGYAMLVWAITQLMPDALVMAFDNGDNPDVLRLGAGAVRIYFGAFFALFMQMAGQHSFVALGKAKQAIFFSLLRKVIILVPLILVLPRFMGADGVFAAEPVSDVLGSAACYATFMLTVWRRELREANK